MPTQAVDMGDGWSFRHPVDPPLAPRMPAMQARDAVHKVVVEMAQRGALDAGNGDVVDAWIERLRPQWLAHHRMVTAEAEAAAQLAAGQYEAEARSAARRAETAQAERDHTQRLVDIFETRLLAPNETPAMGHPDRRRRPRPSVDALEGLVKHRAWRVISVALMVLAAAGDFASFWIVLAGMSAQNIYIVSLLTVAFTAAAVGVMHMVGRTARNLREGQGGLGRVALGIMTAGWVALGAAAFYVRMKTESTTSAGALPVFGQESAPAGEDPMLSAVLLAALYIGSGILAFWIGFSDHHPRMNAYLRLRKRLVAQDDEVADAERRAIESERQAANARAEVRRTAERSAAAESSVDAEIAELKELARIHVAGLLGDPPSTNNLTSGRTGLRAAQDAYDGAVSIPMQPGVGAPSAALNGHANGKSPTH